MANGKNTIQNIPLLGNLNLNTLKTEVRPFNGYNEKNSTVFGGELGPIYNKEKTITYRSADEEKRVLLNSKGEEYTLYEGGFTDPQGTNYEVPRSLKTFKLDVPSTCISSYLHVYNDGEVLIEFYVSQDFKIYYRLYQNTEELKLKDAFAELEKLPWIMGHDTEIQDISGTYINGDAYFAPQPSTYVEGTYPYVFIQNPRILIAVWGQLSSDNAGAKEGKLHYVTFDFSDLDNISFVGDGGYNYKGSHNFASAAKVNYGYEYGSDVKTVTITYTPSSGSSSSVSGSQTVLFTSSRMCHTLQFMTIIGEYTLLETALLNPAIYDFYIDSDTWQVDNTVTMTLTPPNTSFFRTIGNMNITYSIPSNLSKTVSFPITRGFKSLNSEPLFTYNTSSIKGAKFDASDYFVMYLGYKGYTSTGFLINGSSIQSPYVFNFFKNYEGNSIAIKNDLAISLNQYAGRVSYSAPICARLDESTGQYAPSNIESSSHFSDSESYSLVRGVFNFDPADSNKLYGANVLSGHDGEGFIPTPIGYNFRRSYQDEIYRFYLVDATDNSTGDNIYYQSGSLMSISYDGIPVCEPNTISSTTISFTTYGGTYKQYDTGWYAYYMEPNALPDVLCNRYICNKDNNSKASVFDIESNQYIENSIFLGYVFNEYPVIYTNYGNARDNNSFYYYFPIATNFLGGNLYYSMFSTGSQFGGGYNVLYNLKNANLTGYTPNAYNITKVLHATSENTSSSGDIVYDYSTINAGFQCNPSIYAIDTFASFGSTVQSADYVGNLDYLSGTTYPIDANGNIILPISHDSTIIKGYANNDLIFNSISNHTYPLVYSNISTVIHAYYQMTMLNNAKGSFTIQTNTYIFDDTNIYSVEYIGGLVSSIQVAAYKDKLLYLGSLPARAIFYSKFNKAFYQFAGDGIISKLFDASDIDEIYYVGQNPATMSLWICTDKGIFIMSDSDMYKLDIITSSVYFFEDVASIIYEIEDKEEPEQIDINRADISLYDLKNGAEEIPIKLKTCFYGLGSELKAGYDCWYIRLHSKSRKEGNLTMKINTITDKGFETESKTEHISPSKYDSNDMIYIKFQPKYQTAVAIQLELESEIPIYQLSLGTNAVDAVAQTSKYNF